MVGVSQRAGYICRPPDSDRRVNACTTEAVHEPEPISAMEHTVPLAPLVIIEYVAPDDDDHDAQYVYKVHNRMAF